MSFNLIRFIVGCFMLYNIISSTITLKCRLITCRLKKVMLKKKFVERIRRRSVQNGECYFLNNKFLFRLAIA